MKTKATLLLIALSFSFLTQAQSNGTADHSPWDHLLLLNVDKDGLVNYEGVTRDVANFYAYFRSLSEIAPQEHWRKEEKLAYWLNVYNASAMKMIIDEYPVTSIKDIENPWSKKIFKTQGVRYSLDQIEHQILRKFNDPRIHFLLNCGSISSPKLHNRAYTAENINEQLEARTREFVNDLQRNQITSHIARISQVFEWYADDFRNNGIDIRAFINKYAKIKIPASAQIQYITYDWGLNKKMKTIPISQSTQF